MTARSSGGGSVDLTPYALKTDVTAEATTRDGAVTAEAATRAAADLSLQLTVTPRVAGHEWRPGRQWMTDFSSAEEDAGVWDFHNAVRTTDGGTPALQNTGAGTYMCAMTKERLRNVDVRVRYRTPAPDANQVVLALARFCGVLRSSQQTITVTGTPTGGTFTLTFNGQTTSAIAFNATAAQVQTALEALSTIGAGNVLCSGGAFPGTAVVATFQAALEGAPVPAITATNSLTGGSSPAVSIATALMPLHQAATNNQLQVAKNFNVGGQSNLNINNYQQGNADSGGTALYGRDALSTTPVRNVRMQVMEDLVRMKAWTETAATSVHTVTIGGSPAGGTFTLTYGGQTTSGIAFNAGSAAVQSALQALSTVGAGNFTVTGTGPYTVTAAGAFASTETTALTGSAAGLTGGSPTLTITQTVYGSTGKEPDWQWSGRIGLGSTSRSNTEIGRAGFGVRGFAGGSNPYIYSLRVTEMVRVSDNLLMNPDLVMTDINNSGVPAFWVGSLSNVVTVTDRFGFQRKALSIDVPGGDWAQWVYADAKGGPGAFFSRPRGYYQSVVDFPPVVEMSIWTKGNNLACNPGQLAATCVTYYYDKDGNVVNGGDIYYYRALGPNVTNSYPNTGGTGTWDWYETKWRMPFVTPEKIVLAHVQFVLHDVSATGQFYIQDVTMRGVA